MNGIVVKSAIPAIEAKTLAAGLLIAESNGELDGDMVQVEGTTIASKSSMMEALNLRIHPLMQEKTGKELIPTYSFARIYRRGDILKKHTDRPSCEVSATLTLGYVADKIWPIFAGDDDPILLDHGDLLIYDGCTTEHWRDALDGDVWVQVFLHYIDANGPYKEYSFDQRNCGQLYETIYKEVLWA